MSSFFHSSSNVALHCNLLVLITDHYTSLWWVYQSTRWISLFPVSVAANKKNCHFQTDTHKEPQGQFYTNSLYSFPVDYDLSIVESSERCFFFFAPATDTAFGSFILLGSAWVYKSLPWFPLSHILVISPKERVYLYNFLWHFSYSAHLWFDVISLEIF